MGAQSLSHWTTREVLNLMPFLCPCMDHCAGHAQAQGEFGSYGPYQMFVQDTQQARGACVILYTLSESSSPHLALLFGVPVFTDTLPVSTEVRREPRTTGLMDGAPGMGSQCTGVYAGVALWLGVRRGKPEKCPLA